MKEVTKLSEVEAIRVHSTLGLYYKNVSGDLYSFHKGELVAKGVYDFKFTNSGFVYTQSEIGDLFVVLNDGSKKNLPGFFYLAFFKNLSQHYAVVRNDSPADLTNKVVLIDQFFESQRPFKSFRANIDGYFATGKTNEVMVFDENLAEVWKRGLTEIDSSLSRNEKLTTAFYTACQTFILPLESGQLLALDISTGKLKWKQEQVGRLAVFDDKIYCVADYAIKELDANTGNILREESMQNLIEPYSFRPTGAHKVYDEYIFAMASGKPGLVAIFNRKTLQFKEMLKLDEMIPIGTDHLHWHNGRLYVLDFGKILHVYEME